MSSPVQSMTSVASTLTDYDLREVSERLVYFPPHDGRGPAIHRDTQARPMSGILDVDDVAAAFESRDKRFHQESSKEIERGIPCVESYFQK